MKSKLNVAVMLSVVLVMICSPITGVAAPKADPAQRDRIVRDWMIQDHGRDTKKCFTSAANADVEAKMVARVLAEAPAAGFTGEMNSLVKSKVPGNNPRWKKLYISACNVRRAKRLKSLLAVTKRIVFTKHYNMGASHYAYTEGLSDAQAERHFIPGTALGILEMTGSFGKMTTLIDDPKGVIRDPDVSYDGKRILFSWKKSDRKDDYHLYEMDLATRKIRQLTSGLGHADYEGVYLPNGNIMFSSTRCVQIVDCWWTEVSNLYICDKDGKLMRRVGFDQVHTNYPQVLADGRVIYTRWDYNDRGQLFPQPLFQMNIDGTAQTEYYGNNSWFPTTIGHARGIPGSDKIIAIATGHHSIQTGALIVIDVKKGRQETQGVTLVAPLVEDKKDRRYRKIDGYTGHNGHFMYPYPLNEKEYISSYSAHQTRRRSKNGFGIYYVREDAARELLIDDPAISCNQPVFLMPRKVPPVRPSVVDYTKKTGTYYVQDVYFGPGLKGIDRGTVKKLRVVAIGYRAAGVHSNGNGGPGGGALVSTPVAIRNGSWDTKTVIGEAKVHSDGSAFFEAPARMPLYFQLVDADGYVVQSMRSWSTLMPGENFACIGCHEDKNATSPPTRTTLAMKAGPKPLVDFYGKSRGFSFIKEIQPILNKHCIKCHKDRKKKIGSKPKPKVAAAKPGAKTDSKDKTAFSLLSETARVGGGRKWSDSYIALTQNGRPNDIVRWLNVQSIPPMLPPYFKGAAKSKLMTMLKGGHNKTKLSREELDKIACWIDLLVPFCGDYMEANAWGAGGEKKYRHFQKKRDDMEAIELKNIKILAGRK